MSFLVQWQIMNSILDGKRPLVFKCQLLTFLINYVILYIASSQIKCVGGWVNIRLIFSIVYVLVKVELNYKKVYFSKVQLHLLKIVSNVEKQQHFLVDTKT